MRPTAGRVLEVLALLRTRPEWSGPELARRLGVTERTVRRDVDRLRDLGYAVESSTGASGGYRLADGTGVPPLLLSDDEAVAAAVALRSAALAGLAEVDEPAISALLKLEATLPPAARRRVQAIQGSVLTMDGLGPTVDLAVLDVVAAAVRDHEELRADYRTHRGTVIRRVLEPHRIVRLTHRWYLIAWDRQADAWRTLRLDRLTPVLPPGRRFTPRPLPDDEVRTAVAEGVTDRPYRWHARLTVLAPAEQVGDVVGPTRSRITAVDAERTTLEGGGDDLAAMALWILSLPFDVMVHQPAEVLPHLRRLAARAARLGEAAEP